MMKIDMTIMSTALILMMKMTPLLIIGLCLGGCDRHKADEPEIVYNAVFSDGGRVIVQKSYQDFSEPYRVDLLYRNLYGEWYRYTVDPDAWSGSVQVVRRDGRLDIFTDHKFRIAFGFRSRRPFHRDKLLQLNRVPENLSDDIYITSTIRQFEGGN